MKIITVSSQKATPSVARPRKLGNNFLWVLTHGEQGRARWEVVIPLSVKDFGTPADEKQPGITLDGDEYEVAVHPTARDEQGNPLLKIVKGPKDPTRALVLLNLEPGFRGGASILRVEGAEKIASGREAQGDAGRMGGAECPIYIVHAPAVITWERHGRLYGSAPRLTFRYGKDGSYSVLPSDKDALANWASEEEAA